MTFHPRKKNRWLRHCHHRSGPPVKIPQTRPCHKPPFYTGLSSVSPTLPSIPVLRLPQSGVSKPVGSRLLGSPSVCSCKTPPEVRRRPEQGYKDGYRSRCVTPCQPGAASSGPAASQGEESYVHSWSAEREVISSAQRLSETPSQSWWQ